MFKILRILTTLSINKDSEILNNAKDVKKYVVNNKFMNF